MGILQIDACAQNGNLSDAGLASRESCRPAPSIDRVKLMAKAHDPGRRRIGDPTGLASPGCDRDLEEKVRESGRCPSHDKIMTKAG